MGLKFDLLSFLSQRHEFDGVTTPQCQECISTVRCPIIIVYDIMSDLHRFIRKRRQQHCFSPLTPRAFLQFVSSGLTQLAQNYAAVKIRHGVWESSTDRVQVVVCPDYSEWVPARKARTHRLRAQAQKKQRTSTGVHQLDGMTEAEAQQFRLTPEGLQGSSNTLLLCELGDLLQTRHLRFLLFELLERELSADPRLSQWATLTWVRDQGRPGTICEGLPSSAIGEGELRAVYIAKWLLTVRFSGQQQRQQPDVVIRTKDRDAIALGLMHLEPGMDWKVQLDTQVFHPARMWTVLQRERVHPSTILFAELLCGTDYTERKGVLHRVKMTHILPAAQKHLSVNQGNQVLMTPTKFMTFLQDAHRGPEKPGSTKRKRHEAIIDEHEATLAFDDIRWLWRYWSTMDGHVARSDQCRYLQWRLPVSLTPSYEWERRTFSEMRF